MKNTLRHIATTTPKHSLSTAGAIVASVISGTTTGSTELLNRQEWFYNMDPGSRAKGVGEI